ncbi:hypothetical protein EI555_013057, partial [Monodon monoceros]
GGVSGGAGLGCRCTVPRWTGNCRCGSAREEVAWEPEREGEGDRQGGGGGRGRAAAREQAGARRLPQGWAQRPGGGGDWPRDGRQARGYRHGAQPPAHAEPPPPPLLQSASISGRGCRGPGCSAEPNAARRARPAPRPAGPQEPRGRPPPSLPEMGTPRPRDERLRWVLGWPASFSETTPAAAVEAEGAPDVSVQASDAAGQSLG